MTTIYLVTDGDYSDYRIVSAHSTKELAERAKELANADNDIEEWELDPELPQPPPGRLPWYVTMNRDGSTDYNSRRAIDEFAPGVEFVSGYFRDPPGTWRLQVGCWARDEAHAVKIANEYRAALIAADLWPSIVVAKWTRCDLSEAAQAIIDSLESGVAQ